jgi:hypothetical protein
MAARENQGLQAIVIVLTILLLLTGVGLLLVNNARKTRTAEVADLQAKASKSNETQAKLQAENSSLKGWIGFDENAAIDGLSEDFKKDQDRYGTGLEEANRHYRPMLEYLSTENRTLAKNEATAKLQARKMKDDLTAIETQKEPQITKITGELEKARTDLANERLKFDEDRKNTAAAQDKMKADLAKLQAAHDESVAKSTTEITQLKNTVSGREQDIAKLREGIPSADQFAQPADGRISWVNQKEMKVWIDLGSADGLRPQVTFSVAEPGSADAEAAKKKGSIEVIRILEPHMAEAQITSDDAKNPLMPGDRIYSQVWDRGRQVGFAIAGLVDIDKDKRSDLQQLKDIITANNGRVDAAPDDSGKKVGKIRVDTRYLVLGQYPEGTMPTDGALRDSWVQLGDEAERLGVQTIGLDEFLKLMGWRVDTRTVKLGPGSRSEDFPPKPEGDMMPRKPVQPTGIFKPRLPKVSY